MREASGQKVIIQQTIPKDKSQSSKGQLRAYHVARVLIRRHRQFQISHCGRHRDAPPGIPSMEGLAAQLLSGQQQTPDINSFRLAPAAKGDFP